MSYAEDQSEDTWTPSITLTQAPSEYTDIGDGMKVKTIELYSGGAELRPGPKAISLRRNFITRALGDTVMLAEDILSGGRSSWSDCNRITRECYTPKDLFDAKFNAFLDVTSSAVGAVISKAAKAESSILTTQRELSTLVTKQSAVVDRWLRMSDNRWAELYREALETAPNFAKGIKGRILDRRMNKIFKEMFGDTPGVRIDQTIPGSGNNLRPDLYLPDLDGKEIIFDVGGSSKINDIQKYKDMADEVIPLIPNQ